MLKSRQSQFKVLHVTHDWGNGGAAIGARRLYGAMKKHGIDCEMMVVINNHPNNPEPIVHDRGVYRMQFSQYLSRKLAGYLKTDNPVLKSLNLVPTGLHHKINSHDATLVQCHWLGANTISIREFGKIRKPVFWKLPDMWAFSGSEHYDLHDDVPRYREGYDQVDRPDYEKGFDLNKWVWRYKKMHWINPKLNLNIVCPSSWLAKCASESLLFRNRQVRHIINPIDTEIFKPCDKKEALEALGLSELVGKKVISFGADAATSAKRKGYDYLVQAIDALESCPDRDSYAFLIFGGPRKQKEYIGSIPTYSLGRIDDVRKLVKLYGASDVFVLPTLRDNLPNVIKEAMVCGVPCVGFDVGGMPDMITHLQDGYLAKPFDAADLARGIQWTLKNITEAGREDIRKIAAARHSEKNAVRQYLEYYKTVVGENDVLNAHINRLSSP